MTDSEPLVKKETTEDQEVTEPITLQRPTRQVSNGHYNKCICCNPQVECSTHQQRQNLKQEWIFGSGRLSWDNSPVASYNPETKMFRCVVCSTVGFMSRIAEHYLGTHANAKVFQCPRCPYSSAWSRCVRMHLSKHHGVQNVPTTLWKGEPLLEEIIKILQTLKNETECADKESGDNADKRYVCPKCPYATDRRDLYARHENIHREDKPFHCYVCFKMFNRADHVKKHFFRIHKNYPYNVSLIRRHPSRSRSLVPNHWRQTRVQNGYQTPVTSSVPVQVLSNQKMNRKKDFKSFVCLYCPWRGVDSWCLRRHLNTHIKPFACSLCDYKAARAERLSTHVWRLHRKLTCLKCSYLTEDSGILEDHVKEYHAESAAKVKLTCSLCFETFDVRSDLETHSILAHSQSLLQCSIIGCDFRTTNPSILENHRQEKHYKIKETSNNSNIFKPSEIICRQCGCEFANENSLQTHTEVYHQNPPDEKFGDPRYPYCCALCGYVSATQRMMMEHMKLHSGRLLLCRAGDECTFCTPLESVLREHVQKEHNDNDGVIHCPHCAQPCSTHHSFIHHYREYHHMGLCQLCNKVEQKYFRIHINPSDGMPLVVSANNFDQQSSQRAVTAPMESSDAQSQNSGNGRRTRKQSSPRKLIHLSVNADCILSGNLPVCDNDCKIAIARKLFLAKYAAKIQKYLETPLLICKLCQKPLYFRYKKNYLLHILYHRKPVYECKKCKAHFWYSYQLLLHRRKLHCQRKEITKR